MSEAPDAAISTVATLRARLNAWGARFAELPEFELGGLMPFSYWLLGFPIGFLSGFLLFARQAAGTPHWYRYLVGLAGGYVGAWLLRRFWPHILVGIALALIISVVGMFLYALWLDVGQMS